MKKLELEENDKNTQLLLQIIAASIELFILSRLHKDRKKVLVFIGIGKCK
jgi:hypothetical protein